MVTTCLKKPVWTGSSSARHFDLREDLKIQLVIFGKQCTEELSRNLRLKVNLSVSLPFSQTFLRDISLLLISFLRNA